MGKERFKKEKNITCIYCGELTSSIHGFHSYCKEKKRKEEVLENRILYETMNRKLTEVNIKLRNELYSKTVKHWSKDSNIPIENMFPDLKERVN